MSDEQTEINIKELFRATNQLRQLTLTWDSNLTIIETFSPPNSKSADLL